MMARLLLILLSAFFSQSRAQSLSWEEFFGDQSFEIENATFRDDGKDIFGARFRAIREAKYSILLANYGFKSDRVAKYLTLHLCRKAREGLAVNVIVDPYGSSSFRDTGLMESLNRCIEPPEHCLARNPDHKLEHCGMAKVLMYEHQTLQGPTELLHALHQKTLIVDGNRAFVGSPNISEWYYSGGRDSSEIYDLEVELTGPVACELASQFIWFWNKKKQMTDRYVTDRLFSSESKTYENDVGIEVPITELPESRAWREYGFRGCRSKGGGRISSVPVPKRDMARKSVARVITGAPLYRNDTPLQDAYFDAFQLARQRIWLFSPYFTVSDAFKRALIDAVARKIDVRVIIPTYGQIKDEFKGTIAYGSYLNAAELIPKGVKIFLWGKNTLHRKGGLIDHAMAMFGSDNFYQRGQTYTSEVMVFTQSPALLGTFDYEFVDTMIFSKEAKLNELEEQIRDAPRSTKDYYSIISWAL